MWRRGRARTDEEKSPKTRKQRTGVRALPAQPRNHPAPPRDRTRPLRASPGPSLSRTFPMCDLVPQERRPLCPALSRKDRATGAGLPFCLRDLCTHMSSGSFCRFSSMPRTAGRRPHSVTSPCTSEAEPAHTRCRPDVTGEARVSPSVAEKEGQEPSKGTSHEAQMC